MRSIAIVDAGPLLASLDRKDPDHIGCAEVLRRRSIALVIPSLVIAEVAHFATVRHGPLVEAAFVRSLADLSIEAPEADDWPMIADLVERYRDFPLGTVDASIAVLADRLETDLIVTLDRRHFRAIQSPQGRRLRLLPELSAVHEEPTSYEAAQA
jgi:predicted nucleic acid-binding protein